MEVVGEAEVDADGELESDIHTYIHTYTAREGGNTRDRGMRCKSWRAAVGAQQLVVSCSWWYAAVG